MVNPLQVKRFLIIGLKVLIAVEFLGAVAAGFDGQGWGRLGLDLILAGILYFLWGKMKAVLPATKEEYKRRIELAPRDEIKLWDALAFSLLWSDEIYRGIPEDRNRLVVISYTLIAIGLLAAFAEIGPGLMPLIVSCALVLGAVNLLAWVVSAERGEKESLRTELKLAHDVQLSLMPKEQPSIEGFDIAGLSIPAQEVGGDHYAYTNHVAEQGLFTISIFDVSGKGMQAAMSAVFTSGAFAVEERNHASPAETLTRLNKAVYANTRRGHFVTYLLATLDIKAKSLRFANAGQTKPLLISGGAAEWLHGSGINFPLGMVDSAQYQDQTVGLKSGDALVLMTDGFTEAMDRSDQQFGEERMVEIARSADLSKSSAFEIIGRFKRGVRNHMNGATQHDDMTMVVVKVL